MIDIKKVNYTKGGHPVRKLRIVNKLAPIEGEIFLEGKWYPAAWLLSGAPEILTKNLKLVEELTLTEGEPVTVKKNIQKVKQLSFFDLLEKDPGHGL